MDTFLGIVLILLYLGATIYGITTKSNKSESEKKLLYTNISKNSSEHKGFTVYDVKLKGLLPNKHRMNLCGVLYLYDEESRLPILSNFAQTYESSESHVFRRNIEFGHMDTGKYFPNWTPVTNVVLEGIQHPYKGTRQLSFEISYFDLNDPVLFKGGLIVGGRNKLIHHSKIKMSLTFDEPGYMDEAQNAEQLKSLIVKIAVGMAMSDGSFHKAEGGVIKKWILQEVNSVADSKKDKLKNALNNALESSYKQLSSGQNINETISHFSEIATKNIKYQTIELCLKVLSSDGVAEESELKLVKELSEKMSLDFDVVQNMRDKTLVKIDARPTTGSKIASDESIVGMDENLDKEEALSIIKKEYRKWNGRLNALDAGKERGNAQRMLDAIARLRTKYESK